MANDEIRLDRELIKTEEKKQTYYSYKRLKLQHSTIDGKTDNIFISAYTSENLRFSPEEAKALLAILKGIFPDEDE